MFYTLQIESEKVVKELNRVKTEISEIISQKQLLKEANIRLNAQLEAMVEDSNVSLMVQSVDSFFVAIVNKKYWVFRLCRMLFQNAKVV